MRAVPAPRFPATPGSSRWIATLAALTAVVALSIDISLPAQPTLAAVFEVDDATAGLTLSLFMIGFAVAQLFAGFWSDAFGRRRVLVVGMALYVVAGLACAVSPNIEVLLVCRVLQGAAAAGGPVIARAMVRDTQPASAAARVMSTMLAALAIAPMVAPVIGGAMLGLFGWRSIFGVLAVVGAAMFALAYHTLAETLPVERRVPATVRGLIRGVRRFVATPATRAPTLIACAVFAGQFSYIAVSPFVLMEGYHQTRTGFALLFAATAASLMAGSLLGARMLRAGRAPISMLAFGTSLLLAGGVLVMLGTHLPGLGIAGFVIPMFVYFAGAGITQPSATALAMQPVPELAGTASAVIGLLTMSSGALAGYLTTRFGGTSPTTFSAVVLGMGIATAVLAAIHRAQNRQPQVEQR